MSEWQTTAPRALIAALRPGGPVYAHSGKLPSYLPLLKNDLVTALRKLPDDHQCTWKVRGDPAETGRYARNRRHVVIWLGT